jgi:hypothetical protein
VEGKMPNTIRVGSKLKKKDAPDYQLEVLELTTPDGDLPHARARISVSRFDLGVRLYSVSALQDTRLFIAESSPATPVELQ